MELTISALLIEILELRPVNPVDGIGVVDDTAAGVSQRGNPCYWDTFEKGLTAVLAHIIPQVVVARGHQLVQSF